MSESNKRARDVAASPRIMMVTSHFSFAKIFAYSMPMMPAPEMTTLFGRKASLAIESESKTRCSSNGIQTQRNLRRAD